MAEPDTRTPGPVLHVCVTCRTGGEALHAALAERAAATDVEVREVRCLAACAHGCTAAISMPGRWSWLLGRLDAEKADDLLAYARLYAASASGTVMPSKRPASLGDMILGRIPSSVHESAS